jgi:uncharacterized protein YbjT (DUF2867 family)
MTQPASPILVTGATGNTGRPLVEALTRRGAPVRAMVRAAGDRGKLPDGVELAVADFDDPVSLAAAVSPVVEQVTGRPARDVTQFARDYASAFSGQGGGG